MAPPEQRTTRLYYDCTSGRWLHRIDTNSGESLSDGQQGCAAAFGLDPASVGIIETLDMSDAEREALVAAAYWDGAPPGQPSPSVTPTPYGPVKPLSA